MTLKPMQADCIFVNKITLLAECSFNKCIEKFALRADYVEKTNPQRGRPIAVKKRFVYECGECGRKVEGTDPDLP